MSKVLITSDWHIRASTPVNRIEESWWTQVLRPKIEWILKQGLPIWHGGDLFDSYNFISLPILNQLKDLFKGADLTIIPGNHDIIGYNHESVKYSAFYNVLGYSHLPQSFAIAGCYSQTKDSKAFFYHGYVAKHKVPWFIDDGITAKELMKQYPDYKIFVCGDNHEPFVVRDGDRVLINPGSLTRTNIKQKDFRPRVYILNTETLEVEKRYVPIQKDVWTAQSIDFEKVNMDLLKEKFQKNLDESLDFNSVVIKLLENVKDEKVQKEIRRWI